MSLQCRISSAAIRFFHLRRLATPIVPRRQPAPVNIGYDSGYEADSENSDSDEGEIDFRVAVLGGGAFDRNLAAERMRYERQRALRGRWGARDIAVGEAHQPFLRRSEQIMARAEERFARLVRADRERHDARREGCLRNYRMMIQANDERRRAHDERSRAEGCGGAGRHGSSVSWSSGTTLVG